MREKNKKSCNTKKSDITIALFYLVTHITFWISGILKCKISGNLRDFSWVTRICLSELPILQNFVRWGVRFYNCTVML